MPYRLAIEDRVVHIAWYGVVAEDDLRQVDRHIPRVAAELGFPPNVLHTFEGVEGRGFEPIAAYAVSLQRKQRKIPAGVKAALVVKHPEAKRLAEMFMALNRSPNLTMASFDAEPAARAWLAETPRA